MTLHRASPSADGVAFDSTAKMDAFALVKNAHCRVLLFTQGKKKLKAIESAEHAQIQPRDD